MSAQITNQEIVFGDPDDSRPINLSDVATIAEDVDSIVYARLEARAAEMRRLSGAERAARFMQEYAGMTQGLPVNDDPIARYLGVSRSLVEQGHVVQNTNPISGMITYEQPASVMPVPISENRSSHRLIDSNYPPMYSSYIIEPVNAYDSPMDHNARIARERADRFERDLREIEDRQRAAASNPCKFPVGTKVTVSLYPTPLDIMGRRYFVVENAAFMSSYMWLYRLEGCSTALNESHLSLYIEDTVAPLPVKVKRLIQPL